MRTKGKVIDTWDLPICQEIDGRLEETGKTVPVKVRMISSGSGKGLTRFHVEFEYEGRVFDKYDKDINNLKDMAVLFLSISEPLLWVEHFAFFYECSTEPTADSSETDYEQSLMSALDIRKFSVATDVAGLVYYRDHSRIHFGGDVTRYPPAHHNGVAVPIVKVTEESTKAVEWLTEAIRRNIDILTRFLRTSDLESSLKVMPIRQTPDVRWLVPINEFQERR